MCNYNAYILGCDAVRFTNGFPSRLTYRVFTLSSSQSTRLIPEMNFTCDGSIVGYKVAGLIGRNHEIQVWRETSPDSQHYDKVDGKQIDDSLCTGGLNSDEVFQCNLTTRISVRSGDILGLKLPRHSRLLFATATKAPTNYVFTGSVSALAEPDSVELLPQITLEIESGTIYIVALFCQIACDYNLKAIPYDDVSWPPSVSSIHLQYSYGYNIKHCHVAMYDVSESASC